MSKKDTQVQKRLTIPWCVAQKDTGYKLTMLTAYDFYTAKYIDEAGVDMILVGDSLGMVIHGKQNTLHVTIDDIIYHTKNVSRAVKRAVIVADMPFLAANISKEQALTNAGRLVSEGGAQAVKIEGANDTIYTHIKEIVKNGIPVMGHIGLTPQFYHTLGGFKIQGREESVRKRLIESASKLEEAGCFAIVLEAIVASSTKKITESVSIPTIGIGAGVDCDGQVLVTTDVLGLTSRPPKFAKVYSNVRSEIIKAAQQYADDVKTGKFPDDKHSYLE